MSAEVTQPLRVALYARVSSEEQREGQTIDSQIKELERFVEANRWVQVGLYKDDGWSGALLVRPALDRLRDNAGRKQFDAVLINDVDRLARDVAHLSVIRRDFERQGVRVIFRKLPAELNPTQNLMINILGSFAEFEREMILDRTRRGVRYKVEIQKQFLGCRPAYGYHYTPKSKESPGQLRLVPEEAAVVRSIYDWADHENLSTHQIVARLNQSQILARKRGEWAKSSVLRVLRNEMYAGVWHYNKHFSSVPASPYGENRYSRISRSSRRLRNRADWIPVNLPVELHIVSRSQWNRVQEKITANLSWSSRNAKHNYMLRSMVRCAGCRARMVGDSKKDQYFYRCHRRCKKVPSIAESRLNHVVWNAVKTAIEDPEIIVAHARKYYSERKRLREESQHDSQKRERALTQIEHEEQRILEAYRQGILEPAQLGRELESLKARRASLSLPTVTPESSGDNEHAVDFVDDVREYCRRVSHVLAAVDSSQIQGLLRTLVQEVIFDGKTVIIKAKIRRTDPAEASRSPDNLDIASRESLAAQERIAPTPLGQCGHNLPGLEFEVVKELELDTTKQTAARRANLAKAQAALLARRGLKKSK